MEKIKRLGNDIIANIELDVLLVKVAFTAMFFSALYYALKYTCIVFNFIGFNISSSSIYMIIALATVLYMHIILSIRGIIRDIKMNF